MNEGFKVPNPYEHLKEGVKPIMVCIGSRENFKVNPKTPYIFGPEKRSASAVRINYLQSSEELNKQGFLNAGDGTYVISQLDERDKFSNEYADCTGLVLSGIDRDTGKNVSGLTHQDPQQFLDMKREVKELFIKDLGLFLRKAKERFLPGTIDVIIFGGNYSPGVSSPSQVNRKKNYDDAIKILSTEVTKVLGFTPRIVNGPKSQSGVDHVYYETEDRRLYFLRDEDNINNIQGFTHEQFEENKSKLNKFVPKTARQSKWIKEE